jgi:hypothetical protein
LLQAIALRLWADLPRDVQEQLFEGAVGTDDALRLELALYLHDHHPRTAHPQKPDMSKLTDEIARREVAAATESDR